MNKELQNILLSNYNTLGEALTKINLLDQDEFFPLAANTKFHLDLLNKYKFFQGYMDGPLKIQNSFFVYGSDPSYNAWALGSSEINIILINAHVFQGNANFYNDYQTSINDILKSYGINLHYDNGLETSIIMKQTAEMYLFYHEAGHVIQMAEPSFSFEKIYENSFGNSEFNINDHVAEFDADMFANIRLASHTKKILERGKENKMDSENLGIAILASILLYRNLLLNNNSSRFYLKENSHPHLYVRMLTALTDISNMLTQLHQNIDQKRIVIQTIEIMNELCKIHPEIKDKLNFISNLEPHISDIQSYYKELLNLTIINESTSYYKKNGK